MKKYLFLTLLLSGVNGYSSSYVFCEFNRGKEFVFSECFKSSKNLHKQKRKCLEEIDSKHIKVSKNLSKSLWVNSFDSSKKCQLEQFKLFTKKTELLARRYILKIFKGINADRLFKIIWEVR